MARRRDPEAQRARRAAADAADVLEAAARSLSGALRSRRSLEERLVAAGYPEAHVMAAVARLAEIGLIDDERYGKGLIEARDRSRQRGDRALLQELKRRGLDESLALRLLEERSSVGGEPSPPLSGASRADETTPGEGAEERAARSALSKIRLRGDDPRREAQRVAHALARRGFPSALAWRLARERVESELRAEVADAEGTEE